MKAVGLHRHLPIDDPDALVDLDLTSSRPTGHDLLVRVEAVSVNPVDTKVRAPQKTAPNDATTDDLAKILGWDAAGTVEAVGPDVTLFKAGDPVYYAGSIVRPGTNAQLHLVDERIVGRKPETLSFAAAAALPLTAITAWESLFDRLRIDPAGDHAGQRLLIIGGAGGVGSIAIQLAAQVARLEVIATASRPESEDWCRQLGAHHVINHRDDLAAQLKAQSLGPVPYVLCLNDTDGHWSAMTEVVAPQGTICSIVETSGPVDLAPLKAKSAGFVFEFMFTRSMFGTPDQVEQHRLLNRVADLIDAGTLRTTLGENLGVINAQNLREAHRKIETGRTVGKIVLEAWG